MLQAMAPREVRSPLGHHCCSRRGAMLAAPTPLYGTGGASTSVFLEKILRESVFPSACSSSPASSPPDDVDTDQAEAEEPAAGFVSLGGAQDHGDRLDEAGATAPAAAALHQPLAAPAVSPSRLPARGGMKDRVLIVANRLPFSAKRLEGDQWKLERSSGGLVSALDGVTDLDMKWIGWPGVSVSDEAGQRTLTQALAKMRCIPVFLSEELKDRYYSGYCNNILWPLLHYLGLPQEHMLKTTEDFESQFKAYNQANEMFADVVRGLYKEGDVIWCHDYHLMFLPMLLKSIDVNMKVGWFLHTPFPSAEIYRTLPCRMELLDAVLHADLVGFHTYDYARHFESACTRILGLEISHEGLLFKGRIVKVEAFPIGIDCMRFRQALELQEVKDKIIEIKKHFADQKVILGVDRLDMIKGFPQKVLAFEKFLEDNPKWKDRVVLLQIAVPSRIDIPEYQKLASQVHEMVARVNGRLGTMKTAPIHHLDQNLDFHALCSLYASADVALVTSLRDGMNLVSYEYTACQETGKGVLILSEFAGAAQSLGAGAIIVNPWNIAEVANSIRYALDMSLDDRKKRHRYNYAHVSTHSAQDWAENYVCELNDTATKAQQQIRQVRVLPIKEAAAQYAQSKKRLLILGFNAALTEQVQSFERRAIDQIEDTELKLNPGLKGPLKVLCDNEDTIVIVVSGHAKSVLDENFAEFDMWLAAENGMFVRKTDEEWITRVPEHLEMHCSDNVKKVFEYFTKRTPRSYAEHRETAFVWNYKSADLVFGRNQAKDMLQQLGKYLLSNKDVDVLQGSGSVEVRPVGVSKGTAIRQLLMDLVHKKIISTPIDYVLCIGHFLAKDEDVYDLFNPETEAKIWSSNCASMFEFDAQKYFSCTVGREYSLAQYKLDGTHDVVSLIQDLATAVAPVNNDSPVHKRRKEHHDAAVMSGT